MLSSRQDRPQFQCCEQTKGPLCGSVSLYDGTKTISSQAWTRSSVIIVSSFITWCTIRHAIARVTLLESELWSVDCSTATVLVYGHQWGVAAVAVASSRLLALGCSLPLSVSLRAPWLWGVCFNVSHAAAEKPDSSKSWLILSLSNTPLLRQTNYQNRLRAS